MVLFRANEQIKTSLYIVAYFVRVWFVFEKTQTIVQRVQTEFTAHFNFFSKIRVIFQHDFWSQTMVFFTSKK